MRLAELMGTLSLATDVGMGMPPEHGLRSAAVAVRIGELAGASDADRAQAFYLALLRYAGCTADSDLATEVMGDEIEVRGALFGADWGVASDFLPRLARVVGRGKSTLPAALAFLGTLRKMPKLLDTARSHCEVGDRLAERIGFDAAFRAALFQTFERWDGKGWPQNVKRDAIALPMRLAHMGEAIDVGFRAGGVEGARVLVKKRARGALDPALAEIFDAKASEGCAPLDTTSPWSTAMGAEPGERRALTAPQVDEVLRAMGQLADLKSRFRRTHADGVADLALRAAHDMRIGDAAERLAQRAALVHDIGVVAVSAGVWDKPGALTDDEWESVRMHAYAGERILSRATSLAEIADIAPLAHERLDGKGYHRRLGASACPTAARVLAAADAYHAMTEERAHRKARTADEASAELSAMARKGSLCAEAVASVLTAAGQPAPRRERPAGLTDREADVLRHVARGLTNKEIAATLGISPKTAGHHVEHIFEKIGVTTRAAAAMFAMERGLLR